MHDTVQTCDLASLLRPVSTADFFDAYWERRPLHIRRDTPGFYDAVLTNRDLEDIISTSELRYPAIMLSKGGVYYPPQAYTTDLTIGRLTFTGVPDVNRICLEYAKGATLSLSSLHRTWGPLSALCARLEETLDYAAHANVYITPGGTAGFPPHYDTHEVLVLQISGRKRWLIDAPPLKLPHSSQRFKAEGFTPGPRVMEADMAAGDALYLPRGYVHSTLTSDSHSAHVTLGLNVLTWADLIREFVPSCLESEACRGALPPGFASRPELRPAVRQHLARLLPGAPVDPDLLIERAICLVHSLRRRIPAGFRTDVSVISEHTPLQTPPRERYEIAPGREHLMLNFDGRKIGFPQAMFGLLEAMCQHATFRIAELAGPTETESVLTFARALQSVGFLRIRQA